MFVAWTGHRPDLFREPLRAQAAVHETARTLVEGEPVAGFVLGGQRGVDTWAALAALRLGVPYTLILPLDVPDFAADWPADDRSLLELTVARASAVRIVGSGGDARQAYSERNRLLATSADLLIAVWTRVKGGGTAETIDFARAAGTPIREVLLDPSENARSAGGPGI
jgi:hypothetical protein